MIYEVKHKTVYEYQSMVSLCHNIVFQVSGNNTLQEINSSKCTIDPEPNFIMEREDFFENKYLIISYILISILHFGLNFFSKL